MNLNAFNLKHVKYFGTNFNFFIFRNRQPIAVQASYIDDESDGKLKNEEKQNQQNATQPPYCYTNQNPTPYQNQNQIQNQNQYSNYYRTPSLSRGTDSRPVSTATDTDQTKKQSMSTFK